ncbi:hypothetical protein HGM15179_002664 [Zosterops borbonicus]|uniref:Uncharacterized protein n=1 Tax=Zosterops borbonicus TaxID=364589 RepID=A0A8K1GUS3_9PASS|nr:hypothetical protein HGM15179_002664 [Zosterops borbonicus]
MFLPSLCAVVAWSVSSTSGDEYEEGTVYNLFSLAEKPDLCVIGTCPGVIGMDEMCDMLRVRAGLEDSLRTLEKSMSNKPSISGKSGGVNNQSYSLSQVTSIFFPLENWERGPVKMSIANGFRYVCNDNCSTEVKGLRITIIALMRTIPLTL